MIRAIEFQNLKGQTGLQNLTGKDIFIGRNGAGKTTRIQSLGIAMLGYVPGQKKTPADTFKLATGECMMVGLQTDNFQFTRSFTRNEKRNNTTGAVTVSIKESLAVSPGQGEKTDTDKKTRVTSEIGDFPVMMDFTEFLNLSDTARRDFVYSLSPITSDSWTRDRIHKYLVAKLLTDELNSNNPEQYAVMLDLINKSINQFPHGFDVSAGLQSMLDWVSTEKSIWDKKQKDAQGAVRQFAEMKNEMAETDRNIAAHKEELESLQLQLVTIEKQISADAEKKKALDRRTARITELNGLINAINSAPAAADSIAIDNQVAELQSQIKPIPNIDDQLNPLKVRLQAIKTEHAALDKEHRALTLQQQEIQGVVKTLESALKQTGDMAGRCVIHQMIKCEKDFSGFGGFVDKKRDEAATSIGELQHKVEHLNNKMTALDNERTSIENQQSSILKNVQDINNQNTRLNKAITDLTSQKNKTMKETTDRANKLKLYNEEITRLTNEPLEAVMGNELQQQQLLGTKNRIAELKTTVAEKEKAKQAFLMLQQSMMDNRKAEYQSVCLKLINEQLGPKGIQGELVKEILEPIRENIGANLKLMGFEYEPFFQTESDTGKEIFQFGWVNEKGHHVNFDALSTGQQTIFLAAMMITIIDRAQPKLRALVMDNLNHLDSINFQLLIDGLSKVEGKLDNIILAGAIESAFTADGWNVYNLSPGLDEEFKAFTTALKDFADMPNVAEVKASA